MMRIYLQKEMGDARKKDRMGFVRRRAGLFHGSRGLQAERILDFHTGHRRGAHTPIGASGISERGGNPHTRARISAAVAEDKLIVCWKTSNLSLRATEGSEAISFLSFEIRDRFVAVAPPASPGEAGAGLAMTNVEYFTDLLERAK
jgi:hypothetical protein